MAGRGLRLVSRAGEEELRAALEAAEIEVVTVTAKGEGVEATVRAGDDEGVAEAVFRAVAEAGLTLRELRPLGRVPRRTSSRR